LALQSKDNENQNLNKTIEELKKQVKSKGKDKASQLNPSRPTHPTPEPPLPKPGD
jgi:hypothetical protein